ncbi:MAG TPA: glycosyl hydrolase [Blastocatellia bacterium]|nr:glycosyl hydrolase [Blastocatellia bacterium]
MRIKITSSLFLTASSLAVIASAQWSVQQSGTTARLRGVSTASGKVVWASGNGGTYARTTDGGSTWRSAVVDGASKLDFRDVQAVDGNTAYLLSIGPGDQSKIYKTTDGGSVWKLQFTNDNPKAFFDAFAFWDARAGIAMSDPVDGRFVLIKTTDGGANWRPVASKSMPPAIEGEGGFAASGTCIAVQGSRNVWFGTGGAAVARVFRSTDAGESWRVATTPITAGSASAGIFSIAFRDALHGVIVGGDYRRESEGGNNVAITSDGGATWSVAKGPRPSGFRSAVAYVPGGARRSLVAVGPSGSDYSIDDGRSWMGLGTTGFHALSLAREGFAGYAVGEEGRIAKMSAIPARR